MLNQTVRRRAILVSLPWIASWAEGQCATPAIRIGVLWDRSGAGASTSGLDQIVAARLAIDDFGSLSRGYPVELLDAEFERRPDQAVDIARRWFEHDKVAAIVDVPGMGAAARVQAMARELNRTILNTGSFNSALTTAACSPTATHWMEDTRALTQAMTQGMAAAGVKTWFLIAPDDVLGAAFRTDAARAIEGTGGRVIGSALHPADAIAFSGALQQAKATHSDAIGLCATGAQLTALIRAARAFGLFDTSRAICAYGATIKDIHTLGAREAGGLWLVTGFYWNQNDRTRSFAARFNEVTGRMPDKPYAATYAAVEHFLRLVETTDTIDGAAVNAAMKRDPVQFFGTSGRLRADGRLMLDVRLYRVKPPGETASSWDYYDDVRTIPARQVFRPVTTGGCSMSP